MRVKREGSSLKVWFSARDTYDWAHRPGEWWPCSELSGRSVFAEFDRGDLVDFKIDGKDGEVSAHEFNCLVEDCLNNYHRGG